MKKILMLCATLIMLMGSVCSASPVRVFDGNMNDFVSLYNYMAQEIYNNAKGKMKVDAKLYQSPLKNIAASNDNYTAYTCKVGNKDKTSPHITFYVDKSGYISQMIVVGHVKDKSMMKHDYEKIFGTSVLLCASMIGLKSSVVDDFADALSSVIMREEQNYQYGLWSQEKKRRFYIDTKQVSEDENGKVYAILFHAIDN